jgi:hypothetical protein
VHQRREAPLLLRNGFVVFGRGVLFLGFGSTVTQGQQ